MATARSRRAQRRNQGSELGARVLVALPAIAFAIFIVVQGGVVFAVGVGLLGVVCLHELFAMYPQARPARLAGFLGLIGLLAAALYGDRGTVLLAFVATIPLTFAIALAQRPPGGPPSIALTVLGLAWIGLAFAHAVLLRDLPHGDAIVVDILVGTFIGDTGAMLGGRLFGRRRMSPGDLAEQDLGGTGHRLRHRRGGRVVRRPVPGLAVGHGRAHPRRRPSRPPRRWATSSSRCSSASPA
jgi:phosphatidate cytidylyltransferase